MAKRNCPYCAHPNATDAKFCVACGAAMHLAPCPHCGSINHINVEKCYRCGGDLPKQEILEGEPEAAPRAESGSSVASGGKESAGPTSGATTIDAVPSVPSGTTPPTVLVRESDTQSGRPSLAVMFIIICSFVFAGLYAARHRGEAKDETVKPAAGNSVQTSPAPSVVPSPTTATTPSAAPAKALDSAPALLAAPKASVPPAKPETGVKPAAKPKQAEPAKPASPATPCTEAVAALGLCKLESK